MLAIVLVCFALTAIFGALCGIALVAPTRLRRRPTTDRLYRRPPEPVDAIAQRNELWAALYPHGVVRPAIDPKTGASIHEVDVKSWLYVRELELASYGHYYHRANGTTNACGWEPIDEAEDAVQEYMAKLEKTNAMRKGISAAEAERQAKIIADGMLDEDPGLTPQAIQKMPMTEYKAARERALRAKPCHCNYCRGRTGVHGEDARALYQAEVKLAMAAAADDLEWADVVLRAATTVRMGDNRVNFDPDISYRVSMPVYRELIARQIVVSAAIHGIM